MRSSRGDIGLALLRLETVGAGEFFANNAKVTPSSPEWMRLPTE